MAFSDWPRLTAACIALAACGAAAQQVEAPVDQSEVIRQLIAAGGVSTAMLPDCQGGGLVENATTLGDDLAAHLAELSAGGGSVQSDCQPDGVCQLAVGQDLGELVWTRFYRFRLQEGRVDPGSLECFTVP